MGKLTKEQVVAAVVGERDYQDNKHGSIEKYPHSIAEWIMIMESELFEAKIAVIKGGKGRDSVLQEILQTVATGFACLEQHGVEVIEKRMV